MQMMYAGADAFVLPTHGEGWGRPAVEAMAMALPTIVTNWSGTSQFLSDTATYPIPVPELEDSKQGQCLHENDVKSAVLRSDYIARYVHSARGCCCFCFVFLCFFWGGWRRGESFARTDLGAAFVSVLTFVAAGSGEEGGGHVAGC